MNIIVKYKKAFTLIELLVTISIILLMTIVGVPAFSKYGKEMALKQEISQIESLMNQTNISMLNPDKDEVIYTFSADNVNGNVSLSRGDDETEIKKIDLTSGESLDNYTDSTGKEYKKIVCRVTENKCMIINTAGDETEIGSMAIEFFKIINTAISKEVIFSVSANPFKVISFTNDI